MDKLATNNQIVLMRKVVRKAKRHVRQKILSLMRKIQTNKKYELKDPKIVKQYETRRQELEAVKRVNTDEMSKKLLLRSMEDKSNKEKHQSVDDGIVKRFAENKGIRDSIKKFKDENPNCDLWLPHLIELWEKKNQMKRKQVMKKKEKDPKQKKVKEKNKVKGKDEDNSDKEENEKTVQKYEKQAESVKKEIKDKIVKGEALIKRLKFEVDESEESSDESGERKVEESEEKEGNEEEDENGDIPEDSEVEENDSFFVSSKHKMKKKQQEAEATKRGKLARGAKRDRRVTFDEKNLRDLKGQNKFSPVKQQGFKKGKAFEKPNKSFEKSNDAKLHPSWEAKRKAQKKQTIKFGNQIKNKKFKFE